MNKSLREISVVNQYLINHMSSGLIVQTAQQYTLCYRFCDTIKSSIFGGQKRLLSINNFSIVQYNKLTYFTRLYFHKKLLLHCLCILLAVLICNFTMHTALIVYYDVETIGGPTV